MASTEASIQLPSIDSLKVTRGKSEVDKQIESDKPDNNKLNHAKSYLTGLKLGSLKRQKRPGDVWKSGSGLGSAGVAREPRPLGLFCTMIYRCHDLLIICYMFLLQLACIAQWFVQDSSLTDDRGLTH